MTEMLVDAKQWAKKPWNSFGKKKVSHSFYYNSQNYAVNT